MFKISNAMILIKIFNKNLSCLVKYVKISAKNWKKVITYSDSCTGQNRNIKILSLKLLQNTEIEAESIEMKFQESGHNYLPNDSQFAIIEFQPKKFRISFRQMVSII